MKFTLEGELLWNTLLPNLSIGNDQCLLSYDSILIVSGDRNQNWQENGYFHYQVSMDGEVLKYIHSPLPNNVNLNYSSYVDNSTGYLYVGGASDANDTLPDIDVDGVLTRYNIESGEYEYEYFDYVNLFTEVIDIQKHTDSTLVFFSRRRQPTYFGELDWVIERINPDGSRIDIYNEFVELNSDVTVPTMAVLQNGNIVFHFPDDNGNSLVLRVLNNSGEFLFDAAIDLVFWPDVPQANNLIPTQDGGFLVVGRFADRTNVPGPIEFNGMLMKISATGDIDWMHQYRHINPTTGAYSTSNLRDAEELTNGDIIASGSVSNETSDLWFLKVNSHGCLGGDDCGEVATPVKEIEIKKSFVSIYPNPIVSGNPIYIRYNKTEVDITSLQMIDMTGQIVSSATFNFINSSVNTTGLMPGVYFIKIRMKDNSITTKRVVIL